MSGVYSFIVVYLLFQLYVDYDKKFILQAKK